MTEKEKALRTMDAAFQMVSNYAGNVKQKERLALAQLYDYVKGQPEPEDKWIPISECCPTENTYYLTTTIHGNVFCDYWSEDHFDRTETVIAWMKLPDPYRWEDKNNAE